MNNTTVQELNNRNLYKCFISIIVVPTKIYYKEKEDLINEVELYSFFGNNIEGKRQYLTTVLKDDFNKTSKWYDLLLSLKNRGISNVFYAVTTNNEELNKALKLAFNEIQIFISCFDTIYKLSKYYTTSYSNCLASKINRIYQAKDINDYELVVNEFKEEYLQFSFISDLLDEDLKRARKYCEYDYEFRRFIFSYFFYRDTSKALRIASRSKKHFTSIDEIIKELLPYIKKIETGMFCPKKKLKYIINILYETKKELIKCYL